MRRTAKALGISFFGVAALLASATVAAAQQPKQPLRKCRCTCYFFHLGSKWEGTLDDFSAPSCNILSIGQVSGAPSGFCKSGDYTEDKYTVDSCKDLGADSSGISLPPATLPPTGTLPTLQPAKPPLPPIKLPPSSVTLQPAQPATPATPGATAPATVPQASATKP